MDFFLACYICTKDKDYQTNLKISTNDLSHQVGFVLWQHLHLLSFSTMSIILLMVSINCKDILNSYKRKPLIFIIYVCYDLSSSNDICNEEDVGHLHI
jgi:hypothetical protein